MKIADHLSKDTKQKLNKVKSPKKKRKKKQEHLSFRDWEDIMGTRRDTYERRNGAVRRK
jgi:hypothetical protein